MPLGIVNNSDFEAEFNDSGVSHSNPVTHKNEPPDSAHKMPSEMEIPVSGEVPTEIITSDVLIKRHGAGRHLGDVNVPQSLRKMIGDASANEGRQAGLELARSLGISPASVSAYTHPENSSSLMAANKDDITNFLTNRKNKISKRAISKLGLAISMIDETKLKDLKATDLSNVAKNMAQVVKHMEPPVKDDAPAAGVQFVMFAPTVKNETHYETVVAKDNY